MRAATSGNDGRWGTAVVQLERFVWGGDGPGVDAAGVVWSSRIAIVVDHLARLLACACLAAILIAPIVQETQQLGSPHGARADESRPGAPAKTRKGREALLAFYISQPFYQRSDLHLKRPDGTDLTLRGLGWDGDALKFPIDGGVRSVEWWGPAGIMIDFLHNKAVSRLGKGAHGREIADPVIDNVAAEGTIGGSPAPDRVTLTDVFKRLEFTHGHNVLMLTPLLRPIAWSYPVRPYIGVGAGVAVPHVEIWFPGDEKKDRTSEYQYVGPAVQAVAGLEFRFGKGSVFVEYKWSHAWVDAALTAGRSWKNFNLPGDLFNQFMRWWRGEEPRHGRVTTTLTPHQIAVGGGYWLTLRKPTPAP